MPPCVQNHIRSHRLVITCTGMYCIIGSLNSYFFSLSVYQTICAALIDCYSIRDGFRPNVQFNVCRLFVTSIYSGKEKKKRNKKSQYQESTHPQMEKENLTRFMTYTQCVSSPLFHRQFVKENKTKSRLHFDRPKENPRVKEENRRESTFVRI